MLIVMTTLTGSATSPRTKASRALAPSAPTAARIDRPLDRPGPDAPLPVPEALTDQGLDLRAGPAPVPLELQIPSLGVRAAVVGVGITPTNVMDAPMGPAKDPVWQQAFWYRGGAVPGELSTALIAGDINDPLGRPAVFGHIDRLRPGDPLVLRDTRSGLDVRFSVSDSGTYSLDQAADPAVLGALSTRARSHPGPRGSPDGVE